ncbi:adenylate/guanylate cyclase domain-containing protein [Taibaiella sp. KBW10]|uniref:adenylate/guanylate cyclase domain-containing protein n=1 Tax=Taibaiella sp. KBW10 TaxID=2153357 RepID=UPI0013153469|nr:adenylate/guanylate cyclase domain-containing protein [Taibaiella sp. KBW10]
MTKQKWQYLIGFIFLWLCVVQTNAQKNNIGNKDSLLVALSKSNNEAARANINFELGRTALFEQNSREALGYLNKSLEFYSESKDQKKVGRIYLGIGIAYINGLQQSDSGLAALNKAELIAKQVHSDSLLKSVYRVLIYTHSSLGNIKESLSYSRIYLAMGQRTQDNEMLAESYHYIGIAYATMGEMNNALDNYQNAIAYYRKSGNKIGLSDVMLNMGERYYNMQKYDTAKKYLNEALKIAEDLDYKGKQSTILTMLANLYMTQKDTANLKKALEKGTAVSKASGDPRYISSFAVLNGFIDLQRLIQQDSSGKYIIAPGHKQEFEKTVQTITAQLDVYKQSSIDISRWKEIHLLLAIANNILEKPQLAYDNMIAYNRYKDSFANLEKSKQFSEMERKLVSDVAETKVNSANTTRNLSLAGLLLLLLLSGGVFYAYRQKRKDNRLIASEKEKSEHLLLNILPQEVAEELKQNGTSKAKYFNEVTVLFTDFVNFTTMSEKLGAEELLEELNENFTAFDRIMERHGLEKIKTIGDAYLAASGLPVNQARHAQNAVAAALDILDYVEDRKNKVPYGLSIRIGINSGSLIAGIIGVKKFAYDIWGDTVNTAARMEQNSTPGNINISENTYRLIEKEFSCTYRGKIEAKNKGAIDMYFVNKHNSEHAI